jgi:rhodanese-related sulfurtransferase
MGPAPVSPEKARKLFDAGRAVFVDSRNPAAWASAAMKLPGAIRIPVDEAAARLDELPRDRVVITYCT